MAHTHDIGVAIAELLDDPALIIKRKDYEPPYNWHGTCKITTIDDDDPSNLIICTDDECEFRISITKIG